jgi:autotransporter-associated beta strand protein
MRLPFVFTVLLIAGLSNSAYAVDYTWSGPTAGTADWNDHLNWGSGGVGAYPKNQDDVANLTLANTGLLTINLNVAITVGTLNTGNTAGTTSATILAPNGGSLTFDVSADDAQWTHSPTGDATFDIGAPVFLDDSITIYNNRTNFGGRQLIGGNITAASAGTKTIKWLGQEGVAGGGQPYIRIGGDISDGPGQLAVSSQSIIAGQGPGLYLDSSNNTYTGITEAIAAGSADLIVSTSGSLGSTVSGTVIGGGVGNNVLWLRATVIGEALTLSGNGWTGGALFAERNVTIWGGPITLVGDARIATSNYLNSDLTIDVDAGNAIAGDFNLNFTTGAVGHPIQVNDPIATGPGGLTKAGEGTLFLNAVNTYTGDTDVDGGTIDLGSSGGLRFEIGASGVNNKIFGDGTIDLDGVLTFDLSGAGTSLGDTWQIVDTSGGLTANYSAGFSVAGFSESGGIWTLGSGAYAFDESTGVLSVVGVVIPEPGTLVLLVMGGIGLIFRRRK